MSKIKTAVLELLSDGKWHTTPEILDSVTKSCCTNRGNVIKVIHTLPAVTTSSNSMSMVIITSAGTRKLISAADLA